MLEEHQDVLHHEILPHIEDTIKYITDVDLDLYFVFEIFAVHVIETLKFIGKFNVATHHWTQVKSLLTNHLLITLRLLDIIIILLCSTHTKWVNLHHAHIHQLLNYIAKIHLFISFRLLLSLRCHYR